MVNRASRRPQGEPKPRARRDEGRGERFNDRAGRSEERRTLPPRAVTRPAALAVALSLVSFPFLLPHVLEDFHSGIAGRVGLPGDVGAALLGLGLAVQIFGLILAGQRRRAGLALIALAGAVWTLSALWDHGIALLVFGFRGRPLSAIWVLCLMLTQALACAFALVALVRGSPSPQWRQGKGKG